MDVYEAIKSRRTVRDYKPDPIPEDLLHKILQCARWSPSSSNTQKWSFIVIRDRETLKTLGQIATQGPFITQAPLVIAVVMDDAPRPQLDAGRALQQMELMAWSLGLGTCFVTLSQNERDLISEILRVPEDAELITVLPFGYRMDSSKRKGVPRKRVSEIHHEEFFTLED